MYFSAERLAVEFDDRLHKIVTPNIHVITLYGSFGSLGSLFTIVLAEKIGNAKPHPNPSPSGEGQPEYYYPLCIWKVFVEN